MIVTNNEKLSKKVQQSLQSHALPPIAQERSPNPSPVAVVKPMSQSENSKPQSPHLQQTNYNVEPIVKNVSPTLPHANNYNEDSEQQINFMAESAKIRENAQVTDNPQTVKHKLDVGDEKGHFDDRPFDPNLVCLGCRKQFRIGEIQQYRKHYEDCLMRQNELQLSHMDPVIPVGQTVSILIEIAMAQLLFLCTHMHNH